MPITPSRRRGCEDFWNDKRFGSIGLPNDPADELIKMGAEVLISINASPFNKGKRPTLSMVLIAPS